ncbi:MAG: serine/threonine protein kinase [Propionibacteriaceae bacterium]|nr:serine/threonine protein kinase [Propionibacteriaceae bacterium]
MSNFPTPPGAIGKPADATAVLRFLSDLRAWVTDTKDALDDADQAILASGHPRDFQADITLAMSLWQAVQTRQQQLLARWDSGRVDAVALNEITQLVFGRLDNTGQSAFNLPEAGRLVNALLDKLRSQLGLGFDVIMRQVRGLRAQVTRIEEQLPSVPPSIQDGYRAQVDGLRPQLEGLVSKQARGGDVVGELQAFTIRAAKLERDLIVAATPKPAGEARLRPGELVAGQYRVVEPIAKGGLGWIYLATDQRVGGRQVVLKGLVDETSRQAVDAAANERQMLARLGTHPLIVEIYNWVWHAGAQYIVMEYVPGKSLKELLASESVSVERALRDVLAVLPAIAYIHSLGLLYVDFKPANIMVSAQKVMLIDLGSVREIDDRRSSVLGTPGFAAPELAEQGTSIATDIYAIGKTLETVLGDADSPAVRAVIGKATADDPAGRYANVGELEQALRQAL